MRVENRELFQKYMTSQNEFHARQNWTEQNDYYCNVFFTHSCQKPCLRFFITVLVPFLQAVKVTGVKEIALPKEKQP